MNARGVDAQEQAVGDAFVFVGENLGLDLVNTAVVVRGKPRDLVDTPGDLARWWQAAAAHYPDAGLARTSIIDGGDEALLEAAKELRAALRRIFSAVVDDAPVAPDDLAVLNRVLGTGYQALAPAPDGGLQPVFASRDPGPDGTLFPIAHAAYALLTEKDRGRLHRCANDRCVLLFYDTTKSATRRWCSTACMNRARSAERYRTAKEQRAAEDGRDARPA
jgi:predicted RNA-binding Zn ribbon-like protein